MATWKFDPAHTAATFTARHIMVTTVHGRFAPPTGTLEFDPQHPENARVEARDRRDDPQHRRRAARQSPQSADFLEVDKYPTITFKSTKVEVTGDEEARVTGDLTIHGVTRPVTLNVEYLGTVASPFGDQRAGFTASTKINREDWGLTWNVAIEAGGVMVGKDIKIELDLEAILVPETEAEASAAV